MKKLSQLQPFSLEVMRAKNENAQAIEKARQENLKANQSIQKEKNDISSIENKEKEKSQTEERKRKTEEQNLLGQQQRKEEQQIQEAASKENKMKKEALKTLKEAYIGNKLLAISDSLMKKGFYKEASVIDNIIITLRQLLKKKREKGHKIDFEIQQLLDVISDYTSFDESSIVSLQTMQQQASLKKKALVQYREKKYFSYDLIDDQKYDELMKALYEDYDKGILNEEDFRKIRGQATHERLMMEQEEKIRDATVDIIQREMEKKRLLEKEK